MSDPQHTHAFATFEVCEICGQTEAAVEGCHHCSDSTSVERGRCWWCLRPTTERAQPSTDQQLAGVRAALAAIVAEMTEDLKASDKSDGGGGGYWIRGFTYKRIQRWRDRLARLGERAPGDT